MGASSTPQVPVPAAAVDVQVEADEEDLDYIDCEENVLYAEDHMYHMNFAAQVMTAIAATPENTSPVLREAAQAAAALMHEDGLIQMHGLACVHRECVLDYSTVYTCLESLAVQASRRQISPMRSMYEAVFMVLTLAQDSALRPEHFDAVTAQLEAINAIVDTPSTFEFGTITHRCVYLCDRGNVDPDGEPNTYHDNQ
jgi:hypothetical protein